MDSPLRNILVGIGPGGSPRALEAAAALAVRENARLTVLAAVARPPSFLYAAPIALPFDAQRAAHEECTERLHAAVAQLPADVSVTALRRSGSPRAALLAELRDGAYDLVVVGAGRVARALRRRSATRVLVAPDAAPKGRVVFLIDLKPGAEDAFLAAYEQIRHEVASGVDGHLVDQVCRVREGGDQWLITSEWQRLEHFLDWERSDEHRELARPLRECIASARSLKFDVVEETRS